MSTNGLESWAVDLAEVGAVYPFQGWEMVMTALGVICWIGWHLIQFVQESENLKSVSKEIDKDRIARLLERY